MLQLLWVILMLSESVWIWSSLPAVLLKRRKLGRFVIVSMDIILRYIKSLSSGNKKVIGVGWFYVEWWRQLNSHPAHLCNSHWLNLDEIWPYRKVWKGNGQISLQVTEPVINSDPWILKKPLTLPLTLLDGGSAPNKTAISSWKKPSWTSWKTTFAYLMRSLIKGPMWVLTWLASGRA